MFALFANTEIARSSCVMLSTCPLVWFALLTAHNSNSVWQNQVLTFFFIILQILFTLSSAVPLPPAHQKVLLIFTLRVLHCQSSISKMHLTLSVKLGRSFSNIYKTTPYFFSKVFLPCSSNTTWHCPPFLATSLLAFASKIHPMLFFYINLCADIH